MSVMLWGGTEEFDSDKAKNVRHTDPCRPARSNSSSCTTLSVDRPKEQPRCTYPLRDVREIMYLMFFRDSHGYFFCRSSIFHPLCILFDKERRHFVIVYRAE